MGESINLEQAISEIRRLRKLLDANGIEWRQKEAAMQQPMANLTPEEKIVLFQSIFNAKMFLLGGGLAEQVVNPVISRYVAKNGIVIFATRKSTNVRIVPIENLSSWDMTIFIGILPVLIHMEKT